MLNNVIKYYGLRLITHLTNYAKYAGLINYFSDNYDFYINIIDSHVAVSNLPRVSHREIIRNYDVIIGFLSPTEQGYRETEWIEREHHITYYHIPVPDYTPPKLEDYKILCHIFDKHKNNKILIHCYAGKGRSNCGAVVYLMHHRNLNVEEAINEVQQKVPRSGMNRWQLESLYKFYNQKMDLI